MFFMDNFNINKFTFLMIIGEGKFVLIEAFI
ncbi:hypothetical protein Hore_08710 [Halothermothrix orenii H 168]|uniref:Uncharacterized protein n=1 Tax=Halothermothrix orenii (strain H 168 / OCM 544 / DSM 9562) TaxID=373903 RepID=B8CWF8_HALOH|nr:hypothetical protein Hore_08710 [Halothermothrix orenii H 168]